MADGMFTPAIDAVGKKLVDLSTDTFKVLLLTSAYTVDLATHQYLSSIPGGARVATATLTGVTYADGVFNASSVTFPAVAAGSTVTQAVIYKDASPDSSARLIWYFSSPEYSGFPFSTNGLAVSLAWPGDANKIFKIANA